MLIGRHDIENLMRIDPASSCLPNSLGQSNMESNTSDIGSVEVEMEIGDLLLNLRPIKQVPISNEGSFLLSFTILTSSMKLLSEIDICTNISTNF